MLSYPFVILEESGTACEFALDDIYWSGGEETAVEDGGERARGPDRVAPQRAEPLQRPHGDPLRAARGRARTC